MCNMSVPDPFDSFTIFRIFFVVAIGSIICLIGLIGSVLFLYILLHKCKALHHYLIYYVALTILDICILINYILMIGNGVLADANVDLKLYFWWHRHIRFMYVLAKVTQASQLYLLLFASYERCVLLRSWSVGTDKVISIWRRVAAIVISILIGITLRFSSWYEVAVHYEPTCNGYGSYTVSGSYLFKDYKQYKKYLEPMIVVYLPFTILVCLNTTILLELKRPNHTDNLVRLNQQSKNTLLNSANVLQDYFSRKAKFQAAVKTTMAIVAAWIIANALHLFITIAEQFEFQFLRTYPMLYTTMSDLSSILVISTSAGRFIICMKLDPFLRSKLRQTIRLLTATLLHKQTDSKDCNTSSDSISIYEHPVVLTRLIRNTGFLMQLQNGTTV